MANMSNVRDEVDNLGDKTEDKAREWGGRAEQKANELGGKARRAAHEFANEAESRMGEVESSIRSKPVQSVLVAAGIGFLVGLIVTR